MLRSEATLLVILKWLGAGHHYERSPSTNCIKQLTSDRWCEKRKSPDRDRDFKVFPSRERIQNCTSITNAGFNTKVFRYRRRVCPDLLHKGHTR
jgi:hypothetical protein